MKLATALTERSDLQRRISELAVRLSNNAKVQEGEEPSENPNDLLNELDGCINRLETLIRAINTTNSATFCDGVSMTALLARRDCLKQRINVMRRFLDSASARVDRYSRTEIKINSSVPVSELQKEVDGLSKQLRETEEKIQSLNWTTDIDI